MTVGRKKKCRKVRIKPENLACQCFGPVQFTKATLKQLPKVILLPEELQAIVWQDIDGYTMAQASAKMGISKTVYAGIYASARHKLACALIAPTILQLACVA